LRRIGNAGGKWDKRISPTGGDGAKIDAPGKGARLVAIVKRPATAK